jgi:DNA methylase
VGEIILDDAMGWLSQRKANSVNHFIFDMPYTFGFAKNALSDKMTFEQAEVWVTGWASEAYRVARDRAWLVTTCASPQDTFSSIIAGLRNAGWNTHHPQMFWTYPSGYSSCRREPNGSRKGFQPPPQFDPIVIASKGKAVSWQDRLRFLGRSPGTLTISGYPDCDLGSYYEFDRWNPFPMIYVDGPTRDEYEYGMGALELEPIYTSGTYLISPRRCAHPCIKPIKLMMYLLKLFTEVDDIIVDPFVGTGTTIIACDMLARRGIGVELEPKYYALAHRRMKAWNKRVSRVITPKTKRAA